MVYTWQISDKENLITTYSRTGEPVTEQTSVTLSPSFSVMYSVVACGPRISDGGN